MIEISNSVRADHEEVRHILGDAFAEAPEGVEIHVKARRPRVTWRAVCHRPDCLPVNWSDAFATGHWFTRKRDVERLVALGRHGPVERVVSPAGFSGRAYSGIPRMATVRPGARFLVTLHIPTDPARYAGPYPAVRKYPGLKTAPPIPVDCWREELFALGAHEAFHIHQFVTGARVSEIDAEKASLRALLAWRTPTPGPVTTPPATPALTPSAAGPAVELLRLF